MDVWLGDNRVRLLENLLAFGGEVVMTTITAPSLKDADLDLVIPIDTELATKLASVP